MTALEGERRRGMMNAVFITSATGAESLELSPQAAQKAADKVERFWVYRSFIPYVCPLFIALPLCPGYGNKMPSEMASLTRGFT